MLGNIIKKCLTFLAVGVIVVVALIKVCFAGEAKKEKNDDGNLAAFLQLVFPECPPDLRERVLGLASDPEGYFAAHAAEMEELGYDEPYDTLYRSILLSEMQEHNKLWTMDWKGNRSEINAIIEDLSGGEFVDILTEEDGSDDYALADEQLPVASERMRAKGKILLCLDTESDSYTLMVVPLEKADEIVAASEKCGIRIDKM